MMSRHINRLHQRGTLDYGLRYFWFHRLKLGSCAHICETHEVIIVNLGHVTKLTINGGSH